MTRVLVCGSAKFSDVSLVQKVLSKWFLMDQNTILQHGNAKGADQICDRVWSSFGGAVQRFPADWALKGRSAGIKRNERMGNIGADICLAFLVPGDESRQATSVVIAARGHSIPVEKYYQDE